MSKIQAAWNKLEESSKRFKEVSLPEGTAAGVASPVSTRGKKRKAENENGSPGAPGSPGGQIHPKLTMRSMFDSDPDRFKKFSIRLESNDPLTPSGKNTLLFDFSKNIIDESVVKALVDLYDALEVKKFTESMFNGEKINITEDRAVLHTALRHPSATTKNIEAFKANTSSHRILSDPTSPLVVDGTDVRPEVNKVLERIQIFSEKVHCGEWKGCTGKSITDIVNIGIGGSDLGPVMVTQALTPFAKSGINSHFVSNVDEAHLSEVLKKVSYERVLFVVSSKTFTTTETMLNAESARTWFLEKLKTNPAVTDYKNAVALHFVAVSTNKKAVTNFGIDESNMFPFWDWVGGRYSLWSAIGLSIVLYIGFANFEELLRGAHEMDVHFRTAEPAVNVPVLMALLGTWYNYYFDAHTYAVLPYDQYLARFPAYLQQLDMESNGKRALREASPTATNTTGHSGTIVWGEPGTNGQHAFYQLIHQGSRIIPCDFFASVHSYNEKSLAASHTHHYTLLANCLAQSEALMRGKTAQEVRAELEKDGISGEKLEKLVPHKIFPGNRPSTTFLYDALTPFRLGSLIAAYEHKILVQGALYGICSFDQWGVELGKQLAKALGPQLEKKGRSSGPSHDSSTNGLIDFIVSFEK